jgi:hypothetical protein
MLIIRKLCASCFPSFLIPKLQSDGIFERKKKEGRKEKGNRGKKKKILQPLKVQLHMEGHTPVTRVPIYSRLHEPALTLIPSLE